MKNKFVVMLTATIALFLLAYATGSMMSGTLDITQWEQETRIVLGGMAGWFSFCVMFVEGAT